MKFPNAAKGMKKIFTAEILELISTIFLAVAILMIVLALAGGYNGSESGMALMGGGFVLALIFAIVWLVLSFIAFILNLVGIINASRDETNFKSALLFLIIGIVSAIIAGAIATSNSTVSSLLYSLFNLMRVFVTIFVIAGGVKLADRLNRGDISSKGSNVLKLIIVVNVLSLIASLISTFMGGAAVSVASGVILLVAMVLSIIQYFMYLTFLSKAKKMFYER